jgi:hypothetical protein
MIPTCTSPLAILCGFNYLRAGEGSALPVPIARITAWCHNALMGRIYPQGITRAGYFRRSC